MNGNEWMIRGYAIRLFDRLHQSLSFATPLQMSGYPGRFGSGSQPQSNQQGYQNNDAPPPYTYQAPYKINVFDVC